jgi:hypothetical protein
MKKTLPTISISLLVILVLLIGGLMGTFMSVYRHKPVEGLSKQTQLQIRRDWVDYSGERLRKVQIAKYYGTYGTDDDCIVIMFRQFGSHDWIISWEYVDGIRINYGSARHRNILVWRDREFLHLQRAFDLGLLMRNDILTIVEIHDEWRSRV